MTTELLALLDTDPVTGLLAAADLREQRAQAVTTHGRRWFVDRDGYGEPTLWAGADPVDDPNVRPLLRVRHLNGDEQALQHIAAEGTPEHALAEVAVWRTVAAQWHWCVAVRIDVVAAARAYLGGDAR